MLRRRPGHRDADRARLSKARFPDRRQRLLLAAGLGDGAAAVAAWRAWHAAGGDIDRLDDDSYGLMGLVNDNLRAQGAEIGDAARLGGIARRTWTGNQVAAHAAGTAVAALEHEGIAVTLLGPAATVAWVRRGARLRTAERPALLVAPGAERAALRVLAGGGWRALDGREPDALLRAFGRLPLVRDEPGERLTLATRALQRRDGDAGLARGAPEATLGGSRVFLPAAEELIVLACAGGMRAVPRSVLWALDVALLARAAGLEPAEVGRRARERRAVADVRAALACLESIPGALPAELSAVCRALAPSPRDRGAHLAAAVAPAAVGLLSARRPPEARLLGLMCDAAGVSEPSALPARAAGRARAELRRRREARRGGDPAHP